MRAVAALLALVAPLAAASLAGAADRALVIGLDRHADQRLDAPLGTPAANDVAAMRLLLTTKLGFADGNVRVLADETATAEAIRLAFGEWLIAGTGPGDRVFLYFAGHGYFTLDEDREGLVPFDARVSAADGKLKIDGLVSDQEIARLLEALAGRSVTLVVDAGFSGRVSRGDGKAGAADLFRAPPLPEATRQIVVEAKAAEQKEKGSWLDGIAAGVDASVWSAVSLGQVAMIDATDPSRPGGIFTRLFVEGLAGKADRNGNGSVSNAELLAFVTEGSQSYCRANQTVCEMGLTPRLDPAAAHGLAVLPDKAPVKAAAVTPDAVTDLLAKGNSLGVALRRTPEGPVHVGDKDIRFHVTSPHDGFLILLNLTDSGELIQLFPNQFSRQRDSDGRIRAGAELMVPDEYYGLRFDAAAPSSGRIIAVVARRKIDWDKAVGTRAIEVIPREEALQSFLPEIAAALGNPVASADPNLNTEPVEWSVATLRYEITPRP